MTRDDERSLELEAVRRKAERMRVARRSSRQVWRVFAQASVVGWLLVVPIVLGALTGGLLARTIERPAAALIGLVPGAAVGFYLFFRQVRRVLDEEDGS